jgi:hypothetical protein
MAMHTHPTFHPILRLVPQSSHLAMTPKDRPERIDNSDLVLPEHLRNHPALVRLRDALHAMAPQHEAFDLGHMAALRQKAATAAPADDNVVARSDSSGPASGAV